MPINEDENGRNRFDPSKRIRGTLGDKFVESAESDAFSKLKLVANASGIRSDEKPEDISTNNGVKVNRFNIFHTNQNTPFTPAKSIDEVTRRLYSKDTKKHNVLFGYEGEDKKLPIINDIIGEIPMVVTNSVVRNGLKRGSFNTKDIGIFGAAAGAQFGIDVITRLNTVEYNKYFENLEFSKEDVNIINRVGMLENIKFSAVKLAKEVIAPTAIRMALNKFLPDSIKNNTAYKVAVNDLNAPRVATSVVGSIIYNQYAKKVVDKAYKADSTIKDVAKACAVKDLTSRRAISELNVEAIGNVGLRLSDYVSKALAKKENDEFYNEMIKPVLDSGKEIVISKPKTESVKKSTETKKKSATSSTKKVA